jgi:hypothetical protein
MVGAVPKGRVSHIDRCSQVGQPGGSAASWQPAAPPAEQPPAAALAKPSRGPSWAALPPRSGATRRRLAQAEYDRPLACRPPARHAGGMSQFLAKLVKLLKPKRRWLQFRLWSLFLVLTVFGVWLGVVVNRAHRQRDAVAVIRQDGGHAYYDYHQVMPHGWSLDAEPDDPAWMSWLGVDCFHTVLHVNFGDPNRRDAISNAVFERLPDLPRLQRLEASGGSTDDDLAGIVGHVDLEELALRHSTISDAGLKHLAGLAKLKRLYLLDTPVTGAGFKFLSGCSVVYLDLRESSAEELDLSTLKSLPLLNTLPWTGHASPTKISKTWEIWGNSKGWALVSLRSPMQDSMRWLGFPA